MCVVNYDLKKIKKKGCYGQGACFVDFFTIFGSGPEGLIIERDVLDYEPDVVVKASPLAKTVAAQQGVDMSEIQGTGAHGKVMHADILAAVEARNQGIVQAGAKRGEKVIPMKGMRKVIAERMMQSLAVSAQLTHFVRVDMTNAVLLREIYKKNGMKISFNDIVIRATCQALKDFPIMNS